MTNDAVLIFMYCALLVLAIMIGISFNLIRNVRRLEARVQDIHDKEEQNNMERKMEYVNLDIGISQMRGSLELLTTETSKDLNDIQRQRSRLECQLRNLQRDVAVNGNRLHDIVDWTGMDHEDESTTTCVEYWADKAALANIVDPANTEPPAEENKEKEDEKTAVAYRWIFPSCDERVPEELRRPVIGQWYLVVGTIKGLTKSDGQPMIFTDDGLYNGTDFITTQDQRFDNVFAYIRKPSSTDIMPKVFEMALKVRS